jgi:tRNA nucleotidyltransferase (CCA-adding enzyme)
MSSMDVDRLEAEVLNEISPSPEELARVAEIRERLVRTAEAAAHDRHLPLVRALVAGSAARGTFVRGRLDIDLFLLFPPDTPRAQLEAQGLELARAILPTGETRYAEHPYLRGPFEGFAVDAVPGFAITDPSHPLSAVDRTPFHQSYLAERETPALTAQIRLTKQFLRGHHVYGAEARTGGFSGYLIELLVLRSGSLRGLLTVARDWRIPVDLRSSPSAALQVPAEVALVLDDPVDPHRNVASALTRRNLGLFILAAGHYLDRPGRSAFTVPMPLSLSLAEARSRVARRTTHVSVLLMARPNVVEDILYPQLRKAERALAQESERLGFDVIGSASASGPAMVVVVLEIAHQELPAVKVHQGPPAGIDRVGDFLAKWTRKDLAVLQGPYVTSEGRLSVEVEQAERRFESLLNPLLPQLPLGRDLKAMVDERAILRPLSEVTAGPEIEAALGDLLDKRLPWVGASASGGEDVEQEEPKP